MNLSRGDYETIKGGGLAKTVVGESGRGRYAPHARAEIFLFVDFVLS